MISLESTIFLLTLGLAILSVTDAQTLLEIKRDNNPVADPEKLIGGNKVDFVCEATNLASNENPNLKWFGTDMKEITNDLRKRIKVYDQRGDYSVLKLNIQDVKEEDAGSYMCNGTINGQPQSASVRVEVKVPLIITEEQCPRKQKFVQGTSPTIKCQVQGTGITVTWYHYVNNTQTRIASNDARYIYQPEGLKVRNISQSDEKLFVVLVEATSGSENVAIDIVVNIPPTITRGPNTQDATVGSSARMECRATGKPNPSYKFYKDGSSNPLKGDRYQIDGILGVLVIKEVIADDKGQYKCEADNGYPPTASMEARLNVIIPPEIREFVNTTGTEGTSVTLTCKAYGEPPPTISFKKDDTIFTADSSGNIQINQESNLNNMEVTGRLTITDVKADDKGFYTCEAKNQAPSPGTRRAYLTVNYKPRFEPDLQKSVYTWPEKPGELICITDGSPRPTVTWKKNNVAISGYPIKPEDLGPYQVKSTLEVSVDYDNMQDRIGEYICESSNIVGASNTTFTLHQARVPNQPTTSAVNTYPNAVELRISLSYDKNLGPAPNKVKVQWTKANQVMGTEAYNVDESQTRITPTVQNLDPDSTYTFTVTAISPAGDSPDYSLNIQTPSKRVPYDVFVISRKEGTSPTTYDLQWDAPNNGGEPITGYFIRYRKVAVYDGLDNDGNYRFKEETSSYYPTLNAGNNVRYKLPNLEPNNYYQVEVTARNVRGSSKPQPFIFKTEAPTKLPYSPDEGGDSGLPIGVIIAIIIIVFLVLFIIVDVTCYYTRRSGVLVRCLHDKISGSGSPDGKPDDAEKGNPETEKLMSGKEEKAEVEGEEMKGPSGDGPIPEEEEPKEEPPKEIEPEDKAEKIAEAPAAEEKPEVDQAEEAKVEDPPKVETPPATTPSGGEKTDIPGEDKPTTPTA